MSLPKAVRIFFSYAHQDKKLFERLKTHLSGLRRQRLIDEWDDNAIIAGGEIGQLIESELESADIIVLLLSADFFDSDRCYEVEMKYALEQARSGAVRVIPVMLRPTDWEVFPFELYHPLPSNRQPVSTWLDIDGALVEVAQGIRRMVEELAHQAAKAFTPPQRDKSQIWTVPYNPNLLFTDRKALLDALHTYFFSSQQFQTCIQALHGLGGVGKTQLAVEYANRHYHRGDYQAVFWFNAASYDLLSLGVSSLAELLHFPEQDRSDDRRLFSAFRHWLQSHDRWLCVFDNIDTFALIQTILPSQSSGHVLLTTNTRITGPFIHTVPIPEMTDEDGALLLLRRAEIVSEGALWKDVSPRQQTQALAIAQAVEGLPLALDQAGAYLNETGCSLTRYFTLYCRQRAHMLRERGIMKESDSHSLLHTDSVVVTLAFAFQKVSQHHPAALDLLSLLAFLHSDAIPEQMIEQNASELDDPLRTLAANPLLFDRAIATLRSFSLVHRQADSTLLSMHRIVQVVFIDRFTFEQQRQLAWQAVRLIHRVFPKPYFSVWSDCDRYLLQAQQCAEHIAQYQITQAEAAHLLQNLGNYCLQRAWYAKAETYLTSALHLCELRFGVEHPDTAQTLNSLARLSYRQGNYDQAERLHQRALSIRENEYGPAHPKTAQSLNNLAHLYGEQGKYQQAEALFERVLDIDERTAGPEHSTTAITLNNLAQIYHQQGKYLLAEPLYERALAINEHALMPTHPDLSYPLSNLAALYKDQGDYQQAERFYQRAFAICQESLGPEHPETAQRMVDLASLYERQEKYHQAETLYQQALAILQSALRSDHPDVARCLRHLAFLAQEQSLPEKAETLYQQALAIDETALGPEHPETANVLDHLGLFYQQQGDAARAESLLRRGLHIREQVLGRDHPHTAHSLSNLAILLTTQGHYEQAEPLLQQALVVYRQALAPEHPDIALTLKQYAFLLECLNRPEAAAHLQTARSLQEKYAEKYQLSKEE